MPRKHVPLQSEFPYHITDRTHNRDRFELPLEAVWKVMEEHLFFIRHAFAIRIHAFVLMPNHFHLTVTAPLGNVSKALGYFLRETSRQINRSSGRINQNYGARNHKSLITSGHYFMNAYKYVYQNPIRALLCTRAEDYPYSTLHGLCGLGRLTIPVSEDTLLFTPNFDESTLDWINRASDADDVESVRLALRRKTFEFKTCRKTGRPNRLEDLLL